jgi:hypothetical protein
MQSKFQYRIEKKNSKMETISVFTSKVFDAYTEARNAMWKAQNRAFEAGYYASTEIIEVK